MRRATLLFLLSIVGCDTGRFTPDPPGPGGGGTGGGGGDTFTGNTFDHEDNTIDPFDLLARLLQEGPPEISSRLHSCQKIDYASLGRLLKSRGVDLAVAGVNGIPSAGDLYKAGAQALGAPNYGARVGESIEATASGATKLFDIFVQAAPQVIANLARSSACPGASVFDAQGQCDADGLSCIIGFAATPDYVALCNQAVTQASSPDKGKVIAVAALMSAAHACE